MEKKEKKKINGTKKFLIFVALVFFLFLFLEPAILLAALINTFILFFKVFPVLVLAFIVNYFINKFIKEETLKRHLGHDSGIKGYFYAIVAGILIGGPPYLLFPMLGEFKKSGVKDSLLATFLFNRNVKIPFMPVVIFYFGVTYTIVISVLLIFFSIINGLVVGRLVNNRTS